jgi:hypothetical protein
MKRNWLGTVAAAVASIGMVLPTAGLAAPAVTGNDDVALREGGVLLGQVVNQQGQAMANANVSIRYANHEVVRTTTDVNGVFAAKGLRGGQYDILTDEGIRTCRLWAADTAPPAARPAALLVSGENVVRGQGMMGYGHGMGHGHGMVNGWVTWMKAHPYLTAGTVAAAIAVPLAFIDDDDESGS